MATMLDAARWYAQKLGWYVFPCVPNEKRPLTSNGLLAATTDMAQIDAWWGQRPDANIGVACGPSGLVVLDVDVKNNGDASFESLRGTLPAELFETVTASTPSGGQHLLYSAPFAPVQSGVNCIGVGIDIRAQGGYIVVTPSMVNSRGYAWEVGYGPHEHEILAWPAEIAARITRPDRATVLGDSEPIGAGGRNATLASIAGTMRRRGLGYDEIFAALQVTNRKRCQPPLPESEIASIAHSVCRYAPAETHAEPQVSEPESEAPMQRVEIEHFADVLQRIEGVVEDHTHAPKFGLSALDESLGGLLPGRLTTVAARTGVGKSAFAETVSLNVAKKFRVLYYSLEMGSERFVERVAARKAGMRVLDFQKAGRPVKDRSWVDPLDLWVVNKTRRFSIKDLQKHIDLHYPQLVILDHARHIDGWFPKDGRRSDLSAAEIMYSLTDLAVQYKTHIMMLHQCNRESDGKRPELSEMRDAGAVEEASDNALLLYRPWQLGDPNGGTDDTMEIIIAKSRECGYVIAHAKWDGLTMSVRDPIMTEHLDVKRCCGGGKSAIGAA